MGFTFLLQYYTIRAKERRSEPARCNTPGAAFSALRAPKDRLFHAGALQEPGDQKHHSMAIELNKIVAVRFKADDHRLLKDRARERGMTVSELVRSTALGVPPARRRRDVVAQELINQLSRIGNNLNQHSHVLHLMNLRGDLTRAETVLERLAEVQAILLELCNAVAEASS